MPAGRPSEYNPDTYPAIAESLALQGLTDTEIAEQMKVHPCTIYDWKNKHPEFSEAIKRGKRGPDDKVQKALYNRALGYDVTETRAVVVGTGEHAHVQIVEETRHIPPDNTSCIFWLKNRRSEEWRDKQDIEHSGNISIIIDKDDEGL